MNTFLVTVIVTQFLVESLTAYLLYKKRYQVRLAIRNFLGIHDIMEAQVVLNVKINEVYATTHKIRQRQLRQSKVKATPTPSVANDPVLSECEIMAKDGYLINAIKHLRNNKQFANGEPIGLKEAKDIVEDLRDGRLVNLAQFR